VKKQCFQFRVEDLWKSARGEVLVSSWNGSDICRSTGGSLFQRGGTAMAMDRFTILHVCKIVTIVLRKVMPMFFDNL